MVLQQCNGCKALVKKNEYNPCPVTGPENKGWVEFMVDRSTSVKKQTWVEVDLCPTCLKKVMQLLGVEW